MNEEVIKREARDTYHRVVKNSHWNVKPQELFQKIRYALSNLYSPDAKFVFANEIKKQVTDELNEHRESHHAGKSNPECVIEIQAEGLLFYIDQEIGTYPQSAVKQKQNIISEVLKRDKVFVVYSHLDKDTLADIERHFKPFRSQIDFWNDTKLKAGQKWKEEIRKAIKQTKVAILLVSTDFLGSEFISTDELPPLLTAAEEEGAIILIVVVKPYLYEEFPFLLEFHMVNPPDHPLSKMSAHEREELFVNLVRRTKEVLAT